MNETIWLAVAVLGLLTVLHSFALLALARQIGVLHVQLGPLGARMLNPGPQIGDLAPPVEMTDITGRLVSVGGQRPKNTLLLFMAPGCHNCGDLMPALRTWYRSEKADLDIVLISTETSREINEAFITKHRLQAMPFVSSLHIAAQYEISVVPYAALIDRQGRVRAKGLVNNAVHLESLLNAEETGHPCIQHALGLDHLSQNGSAVQQDRANIRTKE